MTGSAGGSSGQTAATSSALETRRPGSTASAQSRARNRAPAISTSRSPTRTVSGPRTPTHAGESVSPATPRIGRRSTRAAGRRARCAARTPRSCAPESSGDCAAGLECHRVRSAGSAKVAVIRAGPRVTAASYPRPDFVDGRRGRDCRSRRPDRCRRRSRAACSAGRRGGTANQLRSTSVRWRTSPSSDRFDGPTAAI